MRKANFFSVQHAMQNLQKKCNWGRHISSVHEGEKCTLVQLFLAGKILLIDM
jgi:hypothetical protein